MNEKMRELIKLHKEEIILLWHRKGNGGTAVGKSGHIFI